MEKIELVTTIRATPEQLIEQVECNEGNTYQAILENLPSEGHRLKFMYLCNRLYSLKFYIGFNRLSEAEAINIINLRKSTRETAANLLYYCKTKQLDDQSIEYYRRGDNLDKMIQKVLTDKTYEDLYDMPLFHVLNSEIPKQEDREKLKGILIRYDDRIFTLTHYRYSEQQKAQYLLEKKWEEEKLRQFLCTVFLY